MSHARRISGPRDAARAPGTPAREPAPDPTTRGAILALQRHVGNAAVTGLVGRRVLARAPGPLTAAQEQAAIRANRALFDSNSIRVIQMTVGTAVDGIFGPISAQAVATFQGANGRPQTGIVDQPTLDVMVTANVAAGMRDETLYLVSDFFGQNTRSDTLTIRHDAALATASANRFEGGNLRVITVGNTAMGTSASISAAIAAQLTAATPAAVVPAAAPAHLTPVQARAAASFNRSKFRDRRSVLAIQGLVGALLDGTFSEDTSQRIAELQRAAGLTVDGKVGRRTLREIVTRLDAAGMENSAIRLIVDFQRLNEEGLLDVSFDPAVAANASTGSAQIPGPTRVRVGPNAFAQGFEGLVHTIAHEYEHVRQRRVGIQSRDIREFLGERIEILSVGMEEEAFAGSGFVDDAARALGHFNAMTVAEQRQMWPQFVQVRNKVRQRFRNANAGDQAANAALLASYNAVVRP